MNDTEGEARRLLARATEDMPPGIDLLGGVVAARQRERARRMRRGAVLAAGITAAAASVTAVTLTTGSAPPALATVTSALTRTLTQSYHVTAQGSTYEIRNGRVTDHSDQYTCTNTVDPVRHLYAASCPIGGVDMHGPVKRVVGRYTYFHSAVATDGKHWIRYPNACIARLPSSSILDITSATPKRMLAEIKKAEKVTVVGPASGPGWAGTKYAFTSGRGQMPGKLSGTVDVDHQGRVRALILFFRFPLGPTGRVWGQSVTRQALAFSDFGAPVSVTPPPADQTLSRNCSSR